ncbi:MAG: DnaA/Hda family protein [Hyphomonadaceae bacterium]|nr:DnaA/Hda family protein [Hyphomonadaceae bacterium]
MEQASEPDRVSGKLSAAQAYELVRRELLTEFGSDFFGAYIDQLRLVAEWNGVLLFRAASSMARDRLRQQAQHRIEARLRAHLPELGQIEILLEQEFPEEVRNLIEARIEGARIGPPAAHPQSFTFDSFCVDESNHRAFTVAQMIGAHAGMAFPIWMVHSAPGCGKTHLLNAIAYESSLRTPERKVLLMTGQEFLEGFQAALHKKRDSSAFKDAVRAPNLLLIDDFQRICGKRATEEEVWSTISEIVRHGGQVVLAADHGVDGLHGIDETLRTKLKGATSCEIHEPNKQLRRRILDARVAHHARLTPGFSVAPAALDMIAERMHVTGRELDGAVGQLVVEFQISGGSEVSMEAAANALQGKLSDGADRRITVQLVQKVVARQHGMSVQQLLERTRRQSIARPRQLAMYLATKMTHASLPDIGQRFGGFDHTTIMYARDRIEELAQTDVKLRSDIETLARMIRREP